MIQRFAFQYNWDGKIGGTPQEPTVILGECSCEHCGIVYTKQGSAFFIERETQ